MTDLGDVLRSRHSSRVPFDSTRGVGSNDLQLILDAARWAPTPHNMQNFEIIAVDDPALIEAIGDITSTVTLEFLRENYEQVSSSDEELARRKVGISARGFPPSWLDPATGRACRQTRSSRENSMIHCSVARCSSLSCTTPNGERLPRREIHSA